MEFISLSLSLSSILFFEFPWLLFSHYKKMAAKWICKHKSLKKWTKNGKLIMCKEINSQLVTCGTEYHKFGFQTKQILFQAKHVSWSLVRLLGQEWEEHSRLFIHVSKCMYVFFFKLINLYRSQLKTRRPGKTRERGVKQEREREEIRWCTRDPKIKRRRRRNNGLITRSTLGFCFYIFSIVKKIKSKWFW